MSEQLTFDDSLELIRCPSCGHVDVMDGFDVLGACAANVFCTDCHCEFDPYTKLRHDGRSCRQCIERRKRQQTPTCMADLMRVT